MRRRAKRLKTAIQEGAPSDEPPVGAAEGCDLLILIFAKNQKIAAFGSSYRDLCSGQKKPRDRMRRRAKELVGCGQPKERLKAWG
ncbi:hypothetical protein C9422_30400 [Pseudomonas sp. B1(2018)]|nr:hypothetical protein C9422_30400 [Pseudomonas sp. B1(2018)]